MSLAAYPNLLEKLRDSEYRRAFTSASVRRWIAMQIRGLRKREDWSQTQLGDAVGKPQNVVSRLEDPSYGKVTLQTLLDFAAAFDVALIVRFGTFGELAAQIADMSAAAMTVPSFDTELECVQLNTRLSDATKIAPGKGAYAAAEYQLPAGSNSASEAAAPNNNLTPVMGKKQMDTASQLIAAPKANLSVEKRQYAGAQS